MKIDTIIEKCRDIFVTKDVFDLRISPLEKISYGMITTVVLSVLGAILTLVLRK